MVRVLEYFVVAGGGCVVFYFVLVRESGIGKIIWFYLFF